MLTALRAAGITASSTADGTTHADADTEAIGRAAASAGVVLLELRAAESGGLEQLFLTLTAETANHPAPATVDVPMKVETR